MDWVLAKRLLALLRACKARPVSLTAIRYGNLRFVTCTASGTAARSTVEARTFRAMTRTLMI